MSLDSSPRRGSKTGRTGGPRRSILLLPKMEHNLEDYLNYPKDPPKVETVLINSATLPFKWLLWTSKGLASLSPGEGMRTRLTNQSSLLGNVAALYLVVAISAFLNPPVSNLDEDQILISIYGVLMFFSGISLTFYICLSLTVMYPLLESVPDFAAIEAYENLALRWGGYEMFLFNGGCQAVLFALVIGAKILYTVNVTYAMVAIFCGLYCVGAFMTREFFIAIDPITSLHMGICRCVETRDRAMRLGEVIRKRLHDYLSKNDENRKDYRDAHYSEMEMNEETFSEFSGTSTPAPTVGFNSNKEEVKENEVRQDRTLTMESEMHISTKKPGFCNVIETVNTELNEEQDKFSEPDSIDADVTVPALDEIFTGARPLLLYDQRQSIGADSIISFGVGRKDVERSLLMSATECENVMHTLLKQGVTTTESLIILLKWHASNNNAVKATKNGTTPCPCAKVDLNHCVSVCVQLGVPMFHAMLVIDYLKPYL